MRNLLTDVPGVRVGHAGDERLASGLTAVVFDAPATASIAIHGGAPGVRDTALLGSVFAIGGSALLLWLVGGHATVWGLAGACMVIGLGLGFIAAPVLVAAQASADWETRGVVTGTNMFARSVGSALGIAVFGAIANAAVSKRIGGSHPSLEHLPASVLSPSIHDVYLASAIASAM